MTDEHKIFWLSRYTDDEFAMLASDMLGYDVNPATIARHRAAIDARRGCQA